MHEPISTGSADLPLTPVHMVWSGELLLDCPIDRAWPSIVDYPKWQNYSIVEHLAGPVGEEGAVVRLKKDEGSDLPPYCALTILLEPQRRIIWKTWPDVRSADNDYFGFVDFAVEPVGGRTRFRYNSLYEFLVRHKSEAELHAFRKRTNEATATMFTSVLPKLRKLVERDA